MTNFIDSSDSKRDESNSRADDVRRDNDTYSVPSVDIYDIDYAILYELKNNFDLTVDQNDVRIPVPVTFANGETWAQIQRNGYIRDKSRKLMTPLITIKRTMIADDDRFPGLDFTHTNPFKEYIHYSVVEKNNKNDWIHKTHNTQESKTFYASRVPRRINVTYDIYIWTETTPQLNDIVQTIMQNSNNPWGDAMKFVANVDDVNFETVNTGTEDRLVKANFTLIVNGILLSEFNVHESNLKKIFSIKRVDFKNELEQYELYPDHMPKVIKWNRY